MTPTGPAITVFISYAHEDEALLQQLHTHLASLERQKLITSWYDRKIVAGRDWANEIDEHIEQASIILLLVSADFIASNYCYEVEMKRAFEREKAGQARVIPIALRPVAWKGLPFTRLQALPADAKPVTTWLNRDEAWTNVIAGIRRAIEDLPMLPKSTARAALPPIWNIPYPRNSFFLGRDDLLERLHAQLQAGQTTALSQSPQAISGLGGIGKTQIAIEYAYRYPQDYEAVLWARAATRDELIASYSEIATLLNLPEQQAGNQEIMLAAVKAWLRNNGQWLLILDNADELALLPPFLPPAPGGHILLTTRAHAMRGLATRLEVETLPDEQGALLLLRRAGLLPPDGTLDQASPDERQQATNLTNELGGLPLALDQAGAYLEETGMPLDEYQRVYQTHRQELLNDPRRSFIDTHHISVATTWSLSFQRVEANNPAAANLLRLCAYLAPDAIPETIFTKGAEHLGDLLAPIAADAYLFAQAIEALRAYSLLTRDPRTQTLSVHRLVQAVTQDSLSAEDKQHWKQRAVLAVSAARPDVTDVKQWPACERWLPHALLCATWIEQEQMSSPEAALLLNGAGYYLRERGRSHEAEPLLRRELAIFERQLGYDYPETAGSLNNLAELYRKQGNYVMAELLGRRALAIREKLLEPDHLDVAQSLNNLAALSYDQGKYKQAEPLYQRALAIREKLLGPRHPDVAQSLNNLGGLYKAQRNYKEAEPLYQRALAIREQQPGPEHPDTASSLNNLAALYRAQGKYAQAEPLYRRALAIYERHLGPEHPDTATSLNSLALLYQTQGNYEQAESLFQLALTIFEQQLGPNHPNTYTVREKYDALLRAMGREEDGEQ